MASSGDSGAIVLAYHDGTRRRVVVGYVGEDGILPYTFYGVKDGQLVAVRPGPRPAASVAGEGAAHA